MVFKKVLGFISVLLYLVIISNFGCSQNIVLTMSSGKPGTVLNEGPAEDHISISRHSSVPLSDADVDKILEAATEMAQTQDGPDDIACDVTLVRDGSVTEFAHSTTPHFIDDFNSYEAVANDNASDVKILASMDWCAGKFRPNVLLGCTSPGDSIAMAAGFPINARQPGDDDALKSIMWLHEYGHLKHLEHRNDPSAVMNEELEPHNNRLNETECG